MDYTNEKEVKFTIKWGQKDYFYFNLMHYLQTRQGKFYLFSTILFLGFIIFNSGGQNLLFSILLVLFVGLINPLTIYIKSKKAFLSNEAMQKEQCYTVNDEGISVQIESMRNKIKWNEIYKVSESKGYITVYVSAVNIFIIPKKVFSGDLERIGLLREIFKTNLPK